jgi:hypothetical protein
MDHFWKGLILGLAALFVTPFSFAGYAQLAAPVGASKVGAQLFMNTAANTGTFIGGFYGPGGVVNVAGKAVVMPAAYRLATNAATVAVTAIRLNPTALVLGAVVPWLLAEGIEWVNGQWQMPNPNGADTGVRYSYACLSSYAVCNGSPAANQADSTPMGACVKYMAANYPRSSYTDPAYQVYLGGLVGGVPQCRVKLDAYQDIGRQGIKWEASETQIPPSNGEPLPVPETKWDEVKAKPLPETVAVALPVPLPVEVPILNPSPALAPQPMRVPSGEPVPVPNTNPQQWSQPVTRITPANNPANPWQVDVTGEDLRLTDPGQKLNENTTVTPTSPEAQPKPDDFCKMNPEALACVQLGGPLEATPLQNVDKQLVITPEGGFGPSNAACPAPRAMTVQGRTLYWDWSIYCDFANGIRPLFIAFGWFVALGSFFGFVKKD